MPLLQGFLGAAKTGFEAWEDKQELKWYENKQGDQQGDQQGGG